MFLGYLYVFVRSYRVVEGICRAFQKHVPHFPTPDYSVIQRRLKRLDLRVTPKTNFLIVDSTGFRMGRAT